MSSLFKRVLRAIVVVCLFGTAAGFSETKGVRKESTGRVLSANDSAKSPLATPSPTRKQSHAANRATATPAASPTNLPIENPAQIPVEDSVRDDIPIPTPTTTASAVVSSTAIRSVSADPVDAIFAAVQQHWNQPATPAGVSGETDGIASGQENPNGGNLPLAENPSLMRSLGQMLISLAFVILLGLSTAWFFRRYFLKKHTLGGNFIEWLGSYALSSKSKVHLIRVGNEHYLIGEGNNSVSLISKIEMASKSLPATDSASLPFEIDETLTPDSLPANAGFKSQLALWQNSLENQGLRQEVNASLVFLKGLTQRLRKKGEQNA